MNSLLGLVGRATKSAGINSCSRNYPDDPKQRGATFWSGFIGAINSEISQVEEHITKLQGDLVASQAENNKLSRQINKLQAQRAQLAGEQLVSEVGAHLTSDQQEKFLTHIRN